MTLRLNEDKSELRDADRKEEEAEAQTWCCVVDKRQKSIASRHE